jgi:hypothetical protein
MVVLVTIVSVVVCGWIEVWLLSDIGAAWLGAVTGRSARRDAPSEHRNRHPAVASTACSLKRPHPARVAHRDARRDVPCQRVSSIRWDRTVKHQVGQDRHRSCCSAELRLIGSSGPPAATRNPPRRPHVCQRALTPRARRCGLGAGHRTRGRARTHQGAHGAGRRRRVTVAIGATG